MPRIQGSWSRPAPRGGTWRLLTPRVNDPAGHEIIPRGIYDSGPLTVVDDTASIDVPFPDLPDSLPAGWRLKLIVDFDGGDHESYLLDVTTSTATIDLAQVLIPQQLDDTPPSLVRGVPGGVAALDADGDVLNAAGDKIIPPLATALSSEVVRATDAEASLGERIDGLGELYYTKAEVDALLAGLSGGGGGGGGQSGPFELIHTATDATGAITLPDPSAATWDEYVLGGDVVFTPPAGFGSAGAGKAATLTVIVRQPDDDSGVYNHEVAWASNVTFLGGTEVAAEAGRGVQTAYTLGTSDDGATWIAAGSEVDQGGNKVVILTDAATVAIDASLGDTFHLDMTAAVGTNRVIGTPTNLVDGKYIELRLAQDGAGGKTVSFSAVWGPGDDITFPLALSAGANKVDYVACRYMASKSKVHVLGLSRGY